MRLLQLSFQHVVSFLNPATLWYSCAIFSDGSSVLLISLDEFSPRVFKRLCKPVA